MSSRILIVEDDPEQSQLYVQVLRLAGQDVEVANTAEDAQQRLGSNDYSLLLADWDLPGRIQGDELITRAKQRQPNLKAILFSNHIHVGEAAEACGADAGYRKYEGIVPLRKLVLGLLQTLM